MKERPILFQGAMVRALLSGTKTQTRRILKPQPRRVDGGVPFGDGPAWAHAEPGTAMMRCPYGQRGDQLWVRESFSPYLHRDGCWYWADGNTAAYDCEKPKPSIHMWRWASRITLEITGVRVERLQDISRGDAMAEGCPFPNMAAGDDPRDWYAELWNQINGPGSWDADPWVWVVEFRRVEVSHG